MLVIINQAAEQGLMLHRSYADMYENVRDFAVAIEQTEEGETVLGVCGLRVLWANLAEVYALAVSPAARSKGLGSQLVEASFDLARQIGIRKLMTLTYEQRFFERLGFKVVDRQNLPLKVWSECLRCAKNQHCDEIAMILELEDMPMVEAPKPPVLPQDEYAVPVQLQIDAPRRKQAEKMSEMPSGQYSKGKTP